MPTRTFDLRLSQVNDLYAGNGLGPASSRCFGVFTQSRVAIDSGHKDAAILTTNFVLNDLLTYRDKRLKGFKWVTGLLTFYLVCGIGALANVGIASALFEKHYAWWLAAGAGVMVGTVFNYGLTSVFTWKK